jgi:hypothetical protein
MGLQDHRLLTARLFFQPSDDTNGFIDCGNCKSHAFVPIAERAPHMASQKGVRTVDLDLPKLEAVKRTLVLDEHFNETLRLLSIGKQLADVVQATSVAATMTITAGNLVRGRSYELGKLGTSNLTAQTAGAVTLVLGVDFTWDAGSGIVTIIDNTKFGSNWVFTFDCEAVTQLSFQALNRLLEQGTFKLLEFDQFDEVPLMKEQFTGQVQVTAWGEYNGDFNEFTVEVLQTT